MGLLDFFTGGNAKVTANSIVQSHKRNKGNFRLVCEEFFIRINHDIMKCGLQKSLSANSAMTTVKNYTDLGVLYLYVGASPDFAVWEDIRSSFAPAIARYLREKGIPEQYVSGVNVKEHY
ncbi:hypothetical protein I5Q23_24780 [Serratia marcescens]|nr:hypothetical protein [Serratia marcescens]